MLTLKSGAKVYGVVTGHAIDLEPLVALGGRSVVVSGVARFRSWGCLLAVEASKRSTSPEPASVIWPCGPTWRLRASAIWTGGHSVVVRGRDPESPRSSVGLWLSVATKTSPRRWSGSHEDGREFRFPGRSRAILFPICGRGSRDSNRPRYRHSGFIRRGAQVGDA